MWVQVLLSDVDIVTLRNPFPHLMRDCDVEAMSDGWDNATAYGALPPTHAHVHSAALCVRRYVRVLRNVAFAPGPSYILTTPSLHPHPLARAGYNDVADDAAMGWARYAHSMRVFVFNSGLFYIRPTPASLDLLDRIALRLAAENGWDQAIFNEVHAQCCSPAPTEPRGTDACWQLP